MQQLQSPEVYAGRLVLVTGGAGFIGSHLVRTLLAAGAKVRVLDDLSSGHRHNVPENAEFLQASVASSDATLDGVIKGCDHVFHLAAMISVPQSVGDPLGSFQATIAGTDAVLRACVRAKVRSFAMASSAAVYGPAPSTPSRETDPIHCVSPYAAGKATGEHLVSAYAACYGLHAVALRLFNIFGPRQDPRSAYAAAIAAFVSAAIEARTPLVFGDGRQTRDFTPVANVVDAFLRAGDPRRPTSGGTFNIGLGRETSLLDVLETLGSLVGRSMSPEFRERRPGDVTRSCADITLASERLGYAPRVDFATGLAETLSWARGATSR